MLDLGERQVSLTPIITTREGTFGVAMGLSVEAPCVTCTDIYLQRNNKKKKIIIINPPFFVIRRPRCIVIAQPWFYSDFVTQTSRLQYVRLRRTPENRLRPV